MAQNIFEQYGIKEVADVQFEALDNIERLGVSKGDIVLYLDTLKVSTIETTADNVEAKGGKGNVSLISWDYGREVTLNLTDALFTPASLAVMMGGAGVEATSSAPVTVRYTQDIDSFDDTTAYEKDVKANATVKFIDMTQGFRGQIEYAADKMKAKTAIGVSAITDGTKIAASGDRIKLFYDVEVGGENTHGYKITIDSDNFPGTYKVYGDTLVRDTNGTDTAFQFVIPKAKVNSEVTLTMEAEGDPSTFDMTLRVLRDDNHEMFQLIKYDFEKDKTSSASTATKVKVTYNNGTSDVGEEEVEDGTTIAKDTEIEGTDSKTYYVQADTNVNGDTTVTVAETKA